MWYYNVDKNQIAISSRVRIARNIEGYNFPQMLNDFEINEITNKIEKSMNKNEKLLKLSDMDKLTIGSLVERHLLSKEYIKDTTNKSIVLNKECSLSIMINEEDHLRIQGFSSGLNIDVAYKISKEAVERINKTVKYSEHKQYGYLTACPTNIGSGIRVSVMLHLPALTRLGYISRLLEDAAKVGITIRGIYGENTAARGNLYQISNQKTMGMTEDEICEAVKKITEEIIKQEKKARDIINAEEIYYEDKIMRALGILKYARRIQTSEAEKLLSLVRIGVESKIIKDIDPNLIQKLSVNIYANNLQLELKKSMDEGERDIERSKYIRRELNK